MLNEVINDLKEIAKNAKSEYLIETLALYLFIAIIFYPPYFETSDSKTYLAQAYLLANGKLYEENHLDAYNLRQMNDKFMSYFPLGQSLWLMPFVKIGFGFVFLSGIIGHLLGWLAFLLILHKMKIKLFYSVFFLFFPPLIYYSRTLMSETISIALLLLGIYFYILQTKKSLAIAGLLFGLTFWFRITNPIIVLPFFAVLLLKNKNAFFYAMTTFLIPIISLIIFNLLNFGTIDTYSIAGEKNFVNLQNNTMILNYLLVLLVGFLPFLSMQYFLFPFLIFSLNYANEKIKIELILSTILSLIFFGAFQIDSVRYIVPTATLMLIFYPIALENLHKKINKKIEFAKSNSFKAFCVLWFLGLLSVLIISQSNLQETKEVAQKIYFSTTENSLILGNYDVEKFLYQGKGKRSFLKVEEKPSEEKILELKRQFQDIFYISINYEKKKPINIIERLKGKSNYQTEIEKI